MRCHTKTGIVLLMIAQILTMVSIVILYSSFFSINIEDITNQTIETIILILPASGIAGIGGILTLIGAILFYVGRKEFGEKHQKFVFYALIIFVISIIISIVIAGITMYSTFSSVSQNMFSETDPSESIDLIRNSYLLPITSFSSIISAIVGGLIWVFGLYNLENSQGKKVLYIYYICLVATAVIVSVFTYNALNEYLFSQGFEDMINANADSSNSFTQLIGYTQWMGPTAIIGFIGTIVSSLLLLFALYIPYKRINSGELVPIQPDNQSTTTNRHCPNCGQAIPFDANICPYCSKRFDDYL